MLDLPSRLLWRSTVHGAARRTSRSSCCTAGGSAWPGWRGSVGRGHPSRGIGSGDWLATISRYLNQDGVGSWAEAISSITSVEIRRARQGHLGRNRSDVTVGAAFRAPAGWSGSADARTPTSPPPTASRSAAPPPPGPGAGPWDASGPPSQLRLRELRATLDDRFGSVLRTDDGEAAAMVTVGSDAPRRSADLTTTRNLSRGGSLVPPDVGSPSPSVGLSRTVYRSASPGSSTQLGPTLDVEAEMSVEGVSSDSSRAWSQYIADRLPDPVWRGATRLRVAVCFVTGPGRNRINLWKPTIDAPYPWLGGELDAPGRRSAGSGRSPENST